jgi:beta-lactamase regulating signal transducer with metallopeptidase domain
MIAVWLTHALLIGTLLALAARVFEAGARLLRLPVRFAWAAALLATLLFAALAPLRRAAQAPEAAGTEQLATMATAASNVEPVSSPLLLQFMATMVDVARTGLDGALRVAARVGAAEGGAVAGRAFMGVWLLASSVLLLLFGATLRRYRRTTRRWPVVELAGERVRVSAGAGPAVVGLVRPEIVVPAWLLESPPAQQRLVIVHEREHLRARDHLLLASGCMAVVLLPWHPAIWWMYARLRLAVELDCDARVLRRGATPAQYGSLLLDIAGNGSGVLFGATALADAPSHLERRLVAMTNRLSRFAAARGVALAAAATLFVIAACETELPSGTELEAMDVAAVENRVAALGVLTEGEHVTYAIDGITVQADVVASLAPERIASIEVVRRTEGGVPAISITTVEAAARALLEDALERSVKGAPPGDGVSISSSANFDGVLTINGERVPPSAMARLSPDDIDRIEVVKGAAATRLFTDAAAVNGVIQITLKPGR